MTPLALAKKAARIAEGKKGDEVRLLDLRKLSSVTDFFVICSSKSIIGVRAIADEILFRLKKDGVAANHVEGLTEGAWVLADFGGVVVHIFLEQIRKYYDLESLWGDAPRKDFRIKPRKVAVKRKGRK